MGIPWSSLMKTRTFGLEARFSSSASPVRRHMARTARVIAFIATAMYTTIFQVTTLLWSRVGETTLVQIPHPLQIWDFNCLEGRIDRSIFIAIDGGSSSAEVEIYYCVMKLYFSGVPTRKHVIVPSVTLFPPRLPVETEGGPMHCLQICTTSLARQWSIVVESLSSLRADPGILLRKLDDLYSTSFKASSEWMQDRMTCVCKEITAE